MRRLFPITSLLTILPLLFSGCHHNAATTGAPPLSPVGAGQAPTLSPFSGPTKVTPPPTGSYATPNTYMGTPPGSLPPGQMSPMPPGTYPPQSNNAVGSGLQPGGWTSSEQAVAQASGGIGGAPNSTVAPVSTYGGASPYGAGSNPTGPKAGGMPVTDLTGAPMPPGYRPAMPPQNLSVAPAGSVPYGAPMNAPPPVGYGTQPYSTPPGNSAPPTNYYPGSSPGSPASSYPNYNPQNVAVPMAGNPSAEIASRLTPLPEDQFATPMNPPSIQSVGPQSGGPSTEPINSSSAGSDQNLMWRTPGSPF